jgi:hypothetical protein
LSKCRTPLLSWNSFRTLSATTCSLTNKFTLVTAFPSRLRSQPIATAVCHVVESVSQGLSLPTTYLPPPLSTQHLFNTNIYSTSLHTQADSHLFSGTIQRSQYLLNHRVWIPRISQADSGEYSCCVDFSLQLQDHYSTPYTFQTAREQSLNWVSGR